MRIAVVGLAAILLGQPAALRPQTATDIHLFPMSGGVGSLTGARPQPMATSPGYENQPFFDPDGQCVLFTANRDGQQTDIYEFDRRTGATRQLTRTPEGEYSPTIPPVRPAAPSLARDGFTVIRVEADGTQRLWQFDRQGQNPHHVPRPGNRPERATHWDRQRQPRPGLRVDARRPGAPDVGRHEGVRLVEGRAWVARGAGRRTSRAGCGDTAGGVAACRCSGSGDGRAARP
ncbi:MAG: PD40 domain-containing protein [Acidobacteria bacterium]|nr:PD40 domain-containing protein [Acidobacteriota bacterium]